MLSHEYFMQMALLEAHEAFEEGEVPVGAVVVCKGQVVAKAHNLTERLKDVTAHAEMQCITMASESLGAKYLQDCTLYVTLEPCVMCAGALAWSQVGMIVYGAEDEKRGYSLFSPSSLHPKTKVIKGILKEECTQLLQKFFIEKR